MRRIRPGPDVELRIGLNPDTRKLILDVRLGSSDCSPALLEAAHCRLLKGDLYRPSIQFEAMAAGSYLIERVTDPYVRGIDAWCTIVRRWVLVWLVERSGCSGPAGQSANK